MDLERTTKDQTKAYGREEAVVLARELGLDPNEVVSYGPARLAGDDHFVEREAPIWMLLDETRRHLLA